MKPVIVMIILTLGLLFAHPSNALVKPIGFTNTVKSIGLGTVTAVKYSSSTTGNVYTKAVEIGAASLGAVFKKRAFSPWGIAITTAIVAAGYFLNESTQNIESGGSAAQYGSSLGRCRINYSGFNYDSNNKTLEFCNNVFLASPNASQYIGPVQDPNVNFRNNYCWYPVGGNANNLSFCWNMNSGAPGYNVATSVDQVLSTAPETVTDEELYAELEPDFSPAQIQDVMIDPNTAAPDTVISEIADVATEIETEEALLNDGDPTNDPAITDSRTIDEVLLEQALEEQAEEQTQEDFSFNATNPIFDTALDTPERTELAPILDGVSTSIDGFASTVGITATAGQCSFDFTVTIAGQSKTGAINFCQFASLFTQIGAVILGIAYLFSGLIVLGVKA